MKYLLAFYTVAVIAFIVMLFTNINNPNYNLIVLLVFFICVCLFAIALIKDIQNQDEIDNKKFKR